MEDWLIVRTDARKTVSQHGACFFLRFDDVCQSTSTQPFARRGKFHAVGTFTVAHG
jgi:hypothetical protein